MPKLFFGVLNTNVCSNKKNLSIIEIIVKIILSFWNMVRYKVQNIAKNSFDFLIHFFRHLLFFTTQKVKFNYQTFKKKKLKVRIVMYTEPIHPHYFILYYIYSWINKIMAWPIPNTKCHKIKTKLIALHFTDFSNGN